MLGIPRMQSDPDDYGVDEDSSWYIGCIGVVIPLPIFIYGVACVVRRVAVIPDRTLEPNYFYGFDAVLLGLALIFGALAVHCGGFLSKMELTWRYAHLAAVVCLVMGLASFVWFAARVLW